MADAVLSAAVERIFGLTEEQAIYHVNFVRGAEKEVRSLAEEHNTIRNVLNDAENRRFQDKNINSWLSRLEHTSYQMEDVLDEWHYALLKLKVEQHQSDVLNKKVCSFVPSSSCLCFKKTAVPLKNSLRCGVAGTKVLVTTRNERVVKMMGSRDSEICHLGLLTYEDCWLLLCHMALPEKNKTEFEDIGKKIAKKCNGLPLAAKTLGSLLRFKSSLEEWEVVLNSEIWKMEKVEVELFPHLLLSYKELSPTLKCCFSYCAVFPKDSIIDVENLIENWMALGYLDSNAGEIELKGQEFFDVLAMHSLFQDFKRNDLGEIKSCKMHDFAQFLRKSGRVEALGLNKATCKVCDPLLVSTVNEFCTLYCNYGETPPSLCDCLKRLRVISFISCVSQSIPQEMRKLIHLRRLRLAHIQKVKSENIKIIFQLYDLQTLALIDCSMEEIPMELGNLIHLRRLNLSKNEALKELPREIGKLIHLRSLNLDRNTSLQELPREIGNLIHLRNLNLNGNTSLKELPREIWNLIHLRHLQLGAVNELSNEIGNLTHLRRLPCLEEIIIARMFALEIVG